MLDKNNGYLYVLIPRGAPAGAPGLYLVKRVNGSDSIVAAAATADIPWVEDWATLTVQASGSMIRLYLNGELIIEHEDAASPSFDEGRLGFRIYGDADEPCSSTFRNISLPG